MCFIERETRNFILKFRESFPWKKTVLRAHGFWRFSYSEVITDSPFNIATFSYQFMARLLSFIFLFPSRCSTTLHTHITLPPHPLPLHPITPPPPPTHTHIKSVAKKPDNYLKLSGKIKNRRCHTTRWWSSLCRKNIAQMETKWLTYHCHEIYREKMVGLKISNYTLKIMIFVNMWNLGQFR